MTLAAAHGPDLAAKPRTDPLPTRRRTGSVDSGAGMLGQVVDHEGRSLTTLHAGLLQGTAD